MKRLMQSWWAAAADHNALIFDAENEIRVYGDLLENNEKYIFDIELRTLYDNSNWVFSLDGFKAEVIPWLLFHN